MMENRRYKKSNYNIFSTIEKQIYLYNTLTKAVVKIDNRDIAYVKCILNNEQIANKNEKYYNFKSILIENGFLIDQEMDEKSVIEYMYKKHRYSDNRLTLVLVPTMKCNLSCYYCFEEGKRMDWQPDNITILKKYIAEYFPTKEYVTMSFFGGEPLLRYKEIKELLKYITKIKNKNRFDILSSITTNGVLLTQKKIDFFVDEGYTSAFQLTIDGNKKSHNTRRVNQDGIPTYEKILYNFKLLIKKNILLNNKLRLLLRINLLNNTVDDIKELLSEFNKEEYCFFKLYFRPIYNTKEFNCNENQNLSTLNEFYDLAAKSGAQIYINKTPFFHCEADGCENKFTILPDLSVWKCINDMDCKDSKIGTINKNGKLILYLNKLAKWEMCDPFKDKKCQDCVKLPLCWGGCPLTYLSNKQRSCYYEKNFDILPLLTEQGSSH